MVQVCDWFTILSKSLHPQHHEFSHMGLWGSVGAYNTPILSFSTESGGCDSRSANPPLPYHEFFKQGAVRSGIWGHFCAIPHITSFNTSCRGGAGLWFLSNPLHPLHCDFQHSKLWECVGRFMQSPTTHTLKLFTWEIVAANWRSADKTMV